MGGLPESLVLTISDRADAERAVASATWLSRPRIGAVHVAIDGVDPARAAALGARIRRLYNDCGCAWGEVTLAVVLVALLLGTHVVGWPAGLGWGGVIAVSAATAVVGKLSGLAWSRRRVRQLLRQLATASV